MPTRLLVSVRDVEEAEAALLGGAALIDVKEPARGSLGKADNDVIRAIARHVADRVPVSAALGEWDENETCPEGIPLSFVKWGPAKASRDLSRWHDLLRSRLQQSGPPEPVFVAYADWECAQAPAVDHIVDLACQRSESVLLIDTHCKEANGASRRPTLLDWLPKASVLEIVHRCRLHQVRVALAGSLGFEEIRDLSSARPDWFAVRGAVCRRRDRTSSVCPQRVRELVDLIRLVGA